MLLLSFLSLSFSSSEQRPQKGPPGSTLAPKEKSRSAQARAQRTPEAMKKAAQARENLEKMKELISEQKDMPCNDSNPSAKHQELIETQNRYIRSPAGDTLARTVEKKRVVSGEGYVHLGDHTGQKGLITRKQSAEDHGKERVPPTNLFNRTTDKMVSSGGHEARTSQAVRRK